MKIKYIIYQTYLLFQIMIFDLTKVIYHVYCNISSLILLFLLMLIRRYCFYRIILTHFLTPIIIIFVLILSLVRILMSYSHEYLLILYQVLFKIIHYHFSLVLCEIKQENIMINLINDQRNILFVFIPK
jgi:hypothetical protein